ncbi:MAG TPA: hypothetical protein VN365_07820 [Candidatus Thermoplasmatota archaeon]|mgnify:CR=1 FL=1|jgi:hypothetical protein|nr:hypothetical protein [Candidatus Thermoplasmatota archaeon]
MDKKEDWKLIEGSRYKIISIGGRDSSLETEGVFLGYATIGIEEAGLVIELSKEQKEESEKLRIVPLHAILAIDVLDVKPHEGKDEEKEPSGHYYG